MQFPLTVRFENGDVENYESIEDLAQNLEDYDSDLDNKSEIRDSLNRLVRLKLKVLNLQLLELVNA